MRIAVFSDIHGNATGFDAMLADLRSTSVDAMVCLGDVAQGGPQPAECLDRLEALRCPVVLGNSDQFLLGVEGLDQSVEPLTERHLRVRAWTLAQLGERHIQFMQTFRPTVEVPLGDGKTLLCFHGSPNSFDHVILPETPEEDFERMVGGRWSALMAGGHVHLQWLRRHGDSLFFNPGSVGLAYDRQQPEDDFRFDPWAEYAVVTAGGDTLGIELRRVGFDYRQVIAATQDSGIPDAEHASRQWELRRA